MTPSPPTSKAEHGLRHVFFGSAILGLPVSLGAATIAMLNGWLFAGVESNIAVACGTLLAAIASTGVAAYLRHKGSVRFARYTLSVTLVGACIGLGVWSWLSTPNQLRLFLGSETVPNDLKLNDARTIRHSSYVHFTASPATIDALIQAKQLMELLAVPSDEKDSSAHASRQKLQDSRGWWRPNSMPNARFFYRHDKSQAIQGWVEAWWVSGATNEVYAFIGG